MAFNNRFDGLDLTPRFTFPEYQADANSNVPVTASQDSVAQPRQPWTFYDIMAYGQAGPSQQPMEEPQYMLGEGYASSSFPPGFDLSWGDILASYMTLNGPLDGTPGGTGTGMGPYRFEFPVEEGLVASPGHSVPHPSNLASQPSSGGIAALTAPEASGEDPLGGHSHLPNINDSQERLGAASLSIGSEERLQETQIVASPSTSSLTRPSDLAGPSSSPANYLPVLPPADGSAAPRSRGKVSTAVAGPSRLVPIAPRAATVEAEVPTVPELRRSSRKRTSPTADHAEAAVLPPPPPKKRRVTNGVASNARQPAAVAVAVSTSAEEVSVAGPSRQTRKGAALPPAAKPLTKKARPTAARAKKDTKAKRPRRTRENVDKHKEADMPSHPCDVVGCSKIWNPYTHDENRRHLQGHFDAGDLESDIGLVCVFDVCQEDMPGKDLLKHMEEDHIGLPYLCPLRCGWRSSRSSYQTQHMHREHKGVSWET